MKRILISALIGSMVVSMYAEKPSLKKIKRAIEQSQFQQVKKLWRKIESKTTFSEQQEILNELIDQAVTKADNEDDLQLERKDYKKIVPGALLWLCGFGGCIYINLKKNELVYNGQENLFWGGFIASFVSMVAGSSLMKSGSAGQRSSCSTNAAVIAKYLQEALEYLQDDTDE